MCLISNRASYNLVIINFVLFNTDAPNENLLRVLELCDQLGISMRATSLSRWSGPYAYQMDTISSTWQDYFRAFLRDREYDLDTTASTLMKKLREDYNIPDDWTQEQAYKVISVRYELELRSVEGVGLENYTLATDVSAGGSGGGDGAEYPGRDRGIEHRARLQHEVCGASARIRRCDHRG